MRRVASGGFELPVSAREAIDFFTPEGERTWVPGWNPMYPGSQPSESSGTVFRTDHNGVETIWLIQTLDRERCVAAYARVTPGHHAGTVSVRCDPGEHGNSVVSVTYDMTLLPGGDPSELDAYDDESFAAMMEHWASAVSRHLPG